MDGAFATDIGTRTPLATSINNTDIGSGTQLLYQTDFVTSTHTGATDTPVAGSTGSTTQASTTGGLDWVLVALALAGIVIVLA